MNRLTHVDAMVVQHWGLPFYLEARMLLPRIILKRYVVGSVCLIAAINNTTRQYDSSKYSQTKGLIKLLILWILAVKRLCANIGHQTFQFGERENRSSLSLTLFIVSYVEDLTLNLLSTFFQLKSLERGRLFWFTIVS